jgi:rhodanese-related sulfurtransferase
MQKDTRAAAELNLETEEFRRRLLESSDGVLLDVRTPMEFAQSHIPDAVNLNISDRGFVEALDSLEKSKPYFVYCRSGNRSYTACRMMKERGFEKVYNLGKGIIEWTGPVE